MDARKECLMFVMDLTLKKLSEKYITKTLFFTPYDCKYSFETILYQPTDLIL